MKLFNWLDFLYPRRCPICKDIVISNDELICPLCEKRIPLIKEPTCKKCGKQLENMEQEYCFDCSSRRHTFQEGIALVVYNELIQNSLSDAKYHNIRQNYDYFCYCIAKIYQDKIYMWKPDVMIAVPLHPSRKRKRGFNQAEEITLRLSNYLNIPYDFHVLKRIKKTLPQKVLNEKQRVKNLQDAFYIFQDAKIYENVVLVDDIYTTGSTIQACTDVLKRMGVKNIYFIAIAIGADVS